MGKTLSPKFEAPSPAILARHRAIVPGSLKISSL
eukprot:COSAG01_NODE_12700_length_1697_cov_27.883605_2_plen_33_part_01